MLIPPGKEVSNSSRNVYKKPCVEKVKGKRQFDRLFEKGRQRYKKFHPERWNFYWLQKLDSFRTCLIEAV
jgi:hypothetical protein